MARTIQPLRTSMMNKRIFVSSTFKDLEQFREAVRAAIRQLGAIDVAMEHFGARDERPLDECIRLVREESDIFVGIYAHRYGFIPEGETISISEAEYNTATEARHPVTNRQYNRFIQHLRGREVIQEADKIPLDIFAKSLIANSRKFDGMLNYLGKNFVEWAKLLKSEYDSDKRFNNDDQPVVGISWYAAVAYCHWLTELSSYNDKGEGRIFRLPTEQEWEWAAGGGKREYPWGDDKPNERRANYGGKVGQTTAVGSYPDGATPDGLMDMAGNVWEWMENLYGHKDYPAVRALRGGSWDDGTEDLRCDSRVGVDPENWFNGVGFRVVCSRSGF
ncbi:MAG: SUMF1/EgtB/PvdO family nonheme iron enzyme [bacterium]